MAIAAAAVWEVRTTGSDTNGGGYVSGGVDYSQQDAAQLALTDVVANGTTTLTSATAGFTSNMVGNIVYLQGGTGALAATRRQITAFTNASTITVDATVATGTGITGNVGGALASLGEAFRNATAQNTFWIKAGTYLVTSTSTNVSGGRILSTTNNTYTVHTKILGYTTTRTDLDGLVGGTKPLLRASGIASTTLITLNSGITMEHVDVDGASLTAIQGISVTGSFANILRNCQAYNCTNSGIITGVSTSWLYQCVATGCSGTGTGISLTSGGRAIGCVSYGNSVSGFNVQSGGTVTYCFSFGNTGASTDGFSGSTGKYQHCVAYDNGRSGFNLTASNGTLENCLAVGNAAYGYTTNASNEAVVMQNCAGYDNTTANVHANIVQNKNFVALTADPFIDAAGNNFSLNNTPGGGYELRETGYPSSYPVVTAKRPGIGSSADAALISSAKAGKFPVGRFP